MLFKTASDKPKIFFRTGTNKSKTIFITTALSLAILFSRPAESPAMGSSPILRAPDPIIRLYEANANDFYKNSKTDISRTRDKLSFVKTLELFPYVYLMDERFIRNENIKKLVTNVRGGNFTIAIIGNILLILAIYTIWAIGHGGGDVAASFVDPGWGLPPHNLYQDNPRLVPPRDCNSQLFAGLKGHPPICLKTEADRNKPHPLDRYITVDSHPEIVVRRGQGQFKTKDHGALAGLPFDLTPKGTTKTLVTEEQIDRFIDVIAIIAEDPDSEWWEKETYQAETTREIDSINIYSEKYN